VSLRYQLEHGLHNSQNAFHLSAICSTQFIQQKNTEKALTEVASESAKYYVNWVT